MKGMKLISIALFSFLLTCLVPNLGLARGGEGVGDGDHVRFCRDSESHALSGPCAGEPLYIVQGSNGQEWCCNKAKALSESDGADAIFNSY